jgi:sec-independent protein translocase protein TatB
MFNIGFSEMLLLGIIALIFIGPKQLPEVARNIARFINEFKRNTENLTDNFKNSVFEASESKPITNKQSSKNLESENSVAAPLNQEKPHENV